jgi:hypothetical protein
MKAKLAVFGMGLLAAALPMLAHHSFSAEFDGTKRVVLKGNITKVDWLNPHIWIYLDVKDDSGKVVQWQCEGGAPNSLTRSGWTKNDLKKGDPVTINGTLAKDASNTCNATNVALPDGRRVFAGTSNPDAQKEEK